MDKVLFEQIRTNSGNSPIPVNPYFADLEGTVRKCMAQREVVDEHYRMPENRELLQRCQDHASKYRTPKKGTQTVAITHPFFPFLSTIKGLQGRVKEESEEYLTALWDFLELRKRSGKGYVVALETAENYAVATSLLSETGLIDDVLFTCSHSGYLLGNQDTSSLRGDEIHFAGGYLGQCLSASIEIIKFHSSPRAVYGIRELILRPHTAPSMKVHPEASTVSIPTRRMLGIQKAKARLGL